MIRGVSLLLRKCSVARWSAMAAQVVSLALLVAGCASGDPSPALGTPTKAESVGSMSQAVNGVDGVQNVLAGSVVVNQYTTLAANANAGDGTITVGSAAALNPGSDPLAAGDLLMIIQMQGATIDQSDPTSRNWGQVTSLGSAGNFELVEVGSVQANVITLVCGLKNSYVTSGAVQVIRVPQYTSVNVSFLAEIVAPAWNGTTGGVVAIRALNTINIGGTINANALGFRGGVADNTSDDGALDVTTYSSATATQGGGKGESIAGRLTLYGRGAPANGGGGGNSHNAAGGGGANARTALQAAWTGQGVMKNVTGATGGATDAWRLDPGYIANGNARTASQGGGRGGYTYSSANQNALLDAGAPGLAAWGGNSRRERGGLGGRPLDNSPTGRLFFGGGGGSGDANNGNQGGGGRGGGIVFLMAGSVTGGGSILANGAAGESSNSGSGSGDGPGGGGAGGSIIIQSPTLTNMTVRADGGVGGNQLINNAEAEGPGGGGGGGYLALPTSQTNVTLSALGALGGTTNSPSLTEFPTNGATSGNDGDPSGNSALVSLCTTGPGTTITTAEPTPTNDPTADFVFAGTPAGGTFECSLDNGAWEACTAAYSTAALADGSHTLRVRAVDSLGFRDSTPASHTWLLDTVAPDTTLTATEPSPTNDPTGDFTFTSPDGTATFECSIDGGAYVNCTSPLSTAALTDGQHTLGVRAKDPAGNVDASPATHTWTVDTTAPETVIDAAEPSPTNDLTGDFVFSSPDATATFECSLDGGAYAACNATYSTPVLAQGSHTLNVRARDPLGNVDATPATHTWVVDLTAPSVAIDTAEPSPTSDPTGDFVFTSNDLTASFECSIDGVAFAPCNASFSTAPLADGPHTLAVRAKDPAGNVSAPPATYGWTVDTAAPETTIDAKEPNPTNDPTGDFTFTSSDPTATFECSIDGGAYANCNATYSTPPLADGPHTLSVRAKDAAGNVDATPETYGWTVDTTAPETTLDAKEPSPTSDPTGDFTFTSNDATATFECSIDGGAYTACTSPFSTPTLADGSHTLDVRAKDAAGNVDATPATHSWVVDTTAPETTLVLTEPNPTSDPTGDFTFTSNDNAALFECSIDGGAYTACTSPFSTLTLADGSHTLDVRAKDAAGNVDATPATHTWVVDATAPETTIATFEPNPTNDPTGDFTFTSNDPTATFECRIDGGAYADCNATYATLALTDGTHTLDVRAKDAVGNVDATPASYEWVVDTTPPDTTIDAKEPNPTNDPTGDFTFTSTESPAAFECSIDGGAYADCSSPYSTPELADGSHTLAVRAKDAAGNVDAVPATYTWTIDATAPDTAIQTSEPDPTNDTTGDFVFTSNEAAATFECSLDGGAYADCSATFSTAALPDGRHTLAVRAKDALGNVDATPAIHEWTVDTAPPDTSIPTAEPSPTNDVSADFVFASDEVGSTFECRIDAAAFAPCSAAFSTPALTAGMHTIEVRAVDRVGNVDPTPATYTWTLTAPAATDTDGDGLPDTEEDELGTDKNDADSDNDGVPDGQEQHPGEDPDGDGLINALDPDSDNDALFDGTELGITTPHADTDLQAAHFIADADPATHTNPEDPDTDDGTVPDGAEDANHNGKVDSGERNPLNPADDVPTPPLDSDDDGLTDTEEETIGTDPLDADSDDDGVLDGAEPNPTSDTDGDGKINPLDPDSDNDGLFDGTELGLDCSEPDTDPKAGSCKADADPATVTLPLDPDTDDGGVRDGAEDMNLDGALDDGETDPTAGHPEDDGDNLDSDSDGLTNGLEEELGTDPNDADTDDDGLLDGQEPNPALDSDADGLTNPLDPDSDNDGLFDGTEAGKDCASPATTASNGSCIADADPTTTTSPIDPDTDDGGVSDGSEDSNLNGKLDAGETDPTAGHGADDGTNQDADADGLSNGVEATVGSDPNDADSDDDGLLDGQEPNFAADSDGDGNKNVVDPDSDNDGLWDGTEAGKACDNAATAAAADQCISDADPSTLTGVLDPDTDDGGVSDGDEDTNKDGSFDEGERDPLDPSDDDNVPGEGGAGGMPNVGGEAGAAGSSGSGGTGATPGQGGAGGDDTGGTPSGGTSSNTSDKRPVVLGGGICSVNAPGGETSGAMVLLGIAAAAAAVSRRRRRG